MTKLSRRRLPVLAVAAAGLTLAGAGIAGAHPGAGHRGGHQGARQAMCEIAPSKLVAVADSAALTRIETRLTELVNAGKITAERKDRILSRRQKQITIRTTMAGARTAPVLGLLGMTAEELKTARKNRELRDILEAKGITREDLRAARREGRTAARAAVTELCGSGSETPAAA